MNGATGREAGPLDRGTDHGAGPANGRAKHVIGSSSVNGCASGGTGRVSGMGAGT